ncbi:MAG: DUF4388 domain-containing protein, partial [Chthoniobacteraceae bacterium]
LWSRTIEEAGLRAESFSVDLFMMDIGLPDGNGLEFLWRMSSAHPNAKAIVLTATPLPEYQMSSAALGVLHFLEKPINPEQLIDIVRCSLSSEQVRADDEAFRATLEQVMPVDIIQLKCLTGATTAIEFRSGTDIGVVHFRDGEVVHAEAGRRSGADAIFKIIGWRCGRMSERPDLDPSETTISCSWQTLLMEAAQRLDESPAVRAG